MKTFDTLYKRTKTGAIQFWSISVQDVDSTMDERAIILKQSGQLGTTSPLLHREEIRAGKQKRNYLQQAEFQAESDWKKKKDEGYKSRQDLGIDISGDLMHYSINHVHYKTLTEALNAVLPQFNTDASGNVKPMLAKTVDWSKVKYPCFIQPKLDGVRCLMVVSRKGPDLDIVFLSRKGKEYTTLRHIAEAVAESAGPEPFILDGEIYSDELSFQQISSAVKKEKEESLKLKFRAYDIITDELQESRWHHTHRLVQEINSPHITTVETHKAPSKEVIMAKHDYWVAAGNEGAMIRHLDGKYGQGQRSSDLLKVKEFDETEFAFQYFETGQREEDLIAVCVTNDRNLNEFRAKMIGTAEHKRKLQESFDKLGDKFVGTMLTVKHFGWTDAGLPRFPVGKSFRDYE